MIHHHWNFETHRVKITAIALVFVGLSLHWGCKKAIVHRVVVDPGHGGLQQPRPDDKWDPVKKKYISPYLPGMTTTVNGRTIYEHIEVLKLAKRLHYHLQLTRDSETWPEFLELLKKFSEQASFPRIEIESILTREHSWNHRFDDPNAPGLNDEYRLYDYPDRKTGRMRPGRISQINQLQPELVVSLHTNPAGTGHPGGMATVLAPAWETFDLIHRIDRDKLPESRFYDTPWSQTWLVTDGGWTPFQAARADTWVYLHGYRTLADGTPNLKKNRGIRQNMITWAYAAPRGWEKKYDPDKPGPYAIDHEQFRAEGTFFDRERSQYEAWRRSGGPLGYGGDNHYASDELLRFAQYGPRVLVEELQKEDAIGPIQPPYTSTYSLPTFTNAIVAYLEIAYLNRKRDRYFMTEYREELAQSLAVGIYALFAGLEIKPRKSFPYHPAGQAIDFKKYGSYFDDVTD